MKKIKIVLVGTLSALLCACNGFFDKDNTPAPTPLVNFGPEIRLLNLWNTGTNSGVGNDYLKLIPAVTETQLFTASKDGVVTATDKMTGRGLWNVNTRMSISGGPHARDGLIFIGSRDGDVIALQQCDGKIVWHSLVSSEVLATPVAGAGIVLVKSIDGKLTALSEQNGQTLWRYEQTEPTFILRGSSAPQIRGDNLVAGFANGNLVKLTLGEGSLHWQQTIAMPEGCFAIQRMIDIDADPIIYNNRVYAATYQGRIVSLDLTTGKSYWTHDISSFMGIATDGQRVYVSDACSHIWAFDAETGRVDWEQTQLQYRNITGPAVFCNYLIVADGQGYLHLLNKQDGHFVARTRVNNSGILATPVVNNNVVYVVTRSGRLAAYRLG